MDTSRPCTSAAPSQHLSAPELKAKAEALGYTVSKVKIAKACREVYTTDKTGAQAEVFMDPTNGSVVATK